MKNKLGQNFLIDKKIALREIKYANITKDDIVLEIGPGKGILTELLSKKAKKVIAIEIDKNLTDNLRKILPDNVELINNDVLNIDLKNIGNFDKIVANLPFQISSPISFKLLEINFKIAVLIYQKEFAERIIAKPGTKNYSRLTVSMYYKAKSELLEIVPKTCFSPQPKVDSAIVKIIPRTKPPLKLKNEKFFNNLIKDLFSHRRKKINTILKNKLDIKNKNVPYLDNRVEELNPEQIGLLSNILYTEE